MDKKEKNRKTWTFNQKKHDKNRDSPTLPHSERQPLSVTVQLLHQFQNLVNGVKILNRSSGFLKFKNCFTGSEAIDWMRQHFGVRQREEGLAIAQLFLDENHIENLNSKSSSSSSNERFQDNKNAFYVFRNPYPDDPVQLSEEVVFEMVSNLLKTEKMQLQIKKNRTESTLAGGAGVNNNSSLGSSSQTAGLSNSSFRTLKKKEVLPFMGKDIDEEGPDLKLIYDNSAPYPRLKSASVERMIDRLCHYRYVDYEFRDAFLLTFRNFLTPLDLMTKLREKLTQSPKMELDAEQFEQWKEKVLAPTQTRVVEQVLEVWMENYYAEDFKDSPQLKESLSSFLEQLTPIPHLRSFMGSLTSLQKQQEEHLSVRQSALDQLLQRLEDTSLYDEDSSPRQEQLKTTHQSLSFSVATDNGRFGQLNETLVSLPTLPESRSLSTSSASSPLNPILPAPPSISVTSSSASVASSLAANSLGASPSMSLSTTTLPINNLRVPMFPPTPSPSATAPEYSQGHVLSEDELKKVVEFYRKNLPASIKKKRPRFGVLSFSARDLAVQMTLVESSLYRNISPLELINMNWAGPQKTTSAPNVSILIAHFNMMTKWLISEVVDEISHRRRTEKMGKIIQLGAHMMAMNNFNGLMEVTASLTSAPVKRLKKSWQSLPEEDKKKFSEFEMLMSHDQNYKFYRARLKEAPPPIIPYVGVHLRDLTFTEEGSKDKDGDLINFTKKQSLWGIVSGLIEHQKISYDRSQTDRQVTDWLHKLGREDISLCSFVHSEENAFKLSQTNEPKSYDQAYETLLQENNLLHLLVRVWYPQVPNQQDEGQ
eukprot:TRINITY_DN350_c0_g2_i1.p1 TRINITY_DN350_c0_g2~~TRINITY_DN350_c0_g2_i1.p1  ORF type:complete len:821 (-),score=186.61 TRINITY_DN350_c0_g2_i1:26-2488(-)